jgi:hypothetical protein
LELVAIDSHEGSPLPYFHHRTPDYQLQAAHVLQQERPGDTGFQAVTHLGRLVCLKTQMLTAEIPGDTDSPAIRPTIVPGLEAQLQFTVITLHRAAIAMDDVRFH